MKVRKARKRDETPPDNALVCLCRQPPYPVARFVTGTLVSVQLRHWARDGCPLRPVPIDPNVYQGRS
jgi:hypothetical protein